jgi:two-component system, OmpR family, sensor histidine kinase ChvG
VSIRLQLLIVALTTLVLPWAGCQYARELETALRDSQEKSLLASAGTIANALSAQPQRVFRESGDAEGFAAARGDLYVYPLRTQPLLDGYRDDWGIAADPTALPTSSGYSARVQAGSTERYLYLYIEVDDSHFDAEPADVHPARDRFDRVDLILQRSDGMQESYFFATAAPGLIAAQRIVAGDQGQDRVIEEPRIQAYWRQASAGYRVEARLPLSFVGPRLWIEAVDGRGPREAGVTAAGAPEGGRLFFTMAGLDELLGTFIRDGTRVTVIDANAFKLGTAGNLNAGTASEAEEDAQSWYRRFMAVDTSSFPLQSSAPDRLGGNSATAALAGQPHAEWVRSAPSQELRLTAAAPIAVDGATRGAVVLEQSADQLLGLRDRAVTRLFDLTLLATAAAVFVMFGFATWISLRIGRLRDAADTAVSSDGKIRLDMPESASADEIGALSRGFERLLARLNEHTLYLRTLGGKLSHELRTPLTIVRSSLDNLESEGLRDDQRRYVNRAREGTQRLQSILSALGAAARVEESIKQAERMSFDLRELLSSAIAAAHRTRPTARAMLHAGRTRLSSAAARQTHRKRRRLLSSRRLHHRASRTSHGQLRAAGAERWTADSAGTARALVRVAVRTAPGPRR